MPLNSGHHHQRDKNGVKDAQVARPVVTRFQVVAAPPAETPAKKKREQENQQQNQNPDVRSVRHDDLAVGAYCLTNSLLGSMADRKVQLSWFCKIKQ